MAPAAAAPASNPIIGFLPLIFIVAIFYFLVFMPMQRQKKQQASMLAGLQAGNEVVTTGGIVGTVVSVAPDTLIVRVKPDNIKLQIARSAVASLVNPEKAAGREEVNQTMSSNTKIRLLIIVAVTLVCIYGIIGLPTSKAELVDNWKKNIRLGTDLRGGSNLVMQIQMQDAFKVRSRYRHPAPSRRAGQGIHSVRGHEPQRSRPSSTPTTFRSTSPASPGPRPATSA